MSIATAITAAQAKVAAAYSKCNDKGATMPAAADQNLSHLAATIDTISGGGGGGVTESDVNFWDYDGTLVAAYTAADFANLAALPEVPTHAGLTAQGWNWTLANAKAVVAKTGCLDIGAQYSTTSGLSELVVDIKPFRLSTWFYYEGEADLDVNWGDGTSSTIAGDSYDLTEHAYAVAGKYTISMQTHGDIWTASFFYDFNDAGRYRDIYTWDCVESRAYYNSSESSFPLVGVTAFLVPYGAAEAGMPICNCILSFVAFPTTCGFQGAYECFSLRRISLSEGATVAYIQANNIENVVIPSTVQDVYEMTGVQNLYLLPTTPPNLDSYATVGVGTIHVPHGTLSAYQSATNWSAYASQMVEMPAAS